MQIENRLLKTSLSRNVPRLLSSRMWNVLFAFLTVVPVQAAMFRQLGSVPLTTDPTEDIVSLHVVSNIAYCLSENTGIVAVDVSNPAAPVRLGHARIELRSEDEAFEDLFVTNGIAYIVGGRPFFGPDPNNRVLTVVDIRDLENPVVLAERFDENVFWDIEVLGNRVYSANFDNYVSIFDITQATNPVRLARFAPSSFGVINDLAVTSNRVFVADSGGLSIYDMSVPTQSVLTASFFTDSFFYGFEVEIDDQRAFLSTYDFINETGRVYVLSLSNSTAVELGRFGTTNFAHNLGVWSNYLIFNPRSSVVGLVAYDVSTPSAPVRAAEYLPWTRPNEFSDRIYNFEVISNYIYIVGEFGLRVLRIDPTEDDTDSDGLPDSWETQNQFDPNVPAGPNSDFDGDGATDYEEFVAGTDPRVGQSALRAEVFKQGSSLTLRWPSVSGRRYSIFRKPALALDYVSPELIGYVDGTPPRNAFVITNLAEGVSFFYFLDVQNVSE